MKRSPTARAGSRGPEPTKGMKTGPLSSATGAPLLRRVVGSVVGRSASL